MLAGDTKHIELGRRGVSVKDVETWSLGRGLDNRSGSKQVNGAMLHQPFSLAWWVAVALCPREGTGAGDVPSGVQGWEVRLHYC